MKYSTVVNKNNMFKRLFHKHNYEVVSEKTTSELVEGFILKKLVLWTVIILKCKGCNHIEIKKITDNREEIERVERLIKRMEDRVKNIEGLLNN